MDCVHISIPPIKYITSHFTVFAEHPFVSPARMPQIPTFSCPKKPGGPNPQDPGPEASKPEGDGTNMALAGPSPGGGEGTKAKKPKAKKDPLAPKAPLGAFMRFAAQERPAVLGELGNLGVGEMGKELGRRWSVLEAGDKARHEAETAEDKKRYKLEMEAYQLSKNLQEKHDGEKVREEGNENETFMEPTEDKQEKAEKEGKENIKPVKDGKVEATKKVVKEPSETVGESKNDQSKKKTQSRKRKAGEASQPAGPIQDYFAFLFSNWNQVRQRVGPGVPPSAVQEELWRLWTAGPPSGKVRKAGRDPAAPKRPPSAYLLFAASERAAAASGSPGLSFGEVSREVARRWGALGEEARRPFLAKARQLKEAGEGCKEGVPEVGESVTEVERAEVLLVEEDGAEA
jgi:hypothetical protein